MRRIAIFLILLCPAFAHACPDLSDYVYPESSSDWPELERQLLAVMNECLDSSEYFALLGAAQLNSGLLAEASESLERSLLLNPDNGTAQVDCRSEERR